ncbi:MAG: DEAD/DEAH box helicase, partial [Caldiserica bacterium]|nr:DEAD/DEAH box helicase [Caldisericota bacterium]
QIDALRRGVDIVVACPGRLLDHVTQGTVDLTKMQVLVLDEADMMLDMGFLPDVRRIIKNLPAQRQNLLFSATMPEDIRHLADAILRDPVTIQIGHSAPVETVSHALYPVPQHLKTPLLIELLKHTDTESVLIFTRTKHRAKKLGEKLAKEGHRVTSLQGNLSQRARQEALGGFRDGTYKVLVATDIAARGIDVTQISHVINYDIPDTTDAYTHRIGRTGRALRSGDAFTLITEEDTILVRDIEKVLGTPIERRTLSGFDYKAPAPRRETEFAWDPRSSMGSSRPQRSAGRDNRSVSAPKHHENSVNPPKNLNHRSETRRPANIRTS